MELLPKPRRRRADAQRSSRPEPIPWRGIALAQLGWLVVIILLAGERAGYLGALGRDIPWNIVLIEATVGLTWAAMLPAIVLLSLRWPLGRRPRAWAIHLALFIVAIVIEALVYVTVDKTLLHAIRWSPDVSLGFADLVRNAMTGHFVSSVKFFGVIVGITHAYIYRRLFEDRQLRAARLEAQLAQSQLQVLRSELHPHFLFNALHAVSTLMHRDVGAADAMLARLGDLLRTSLASRDAHEVALKEELEFLERYVDIERARFGDRLVVRIDAAAETLDACVPPLLLQPLVENALRHGIAPRRGPGTVEVRAWRSGESLRLVVADDGLGAEAANLGSSGIGLANTRRRLRRLYGRAQRFRASPVPSGGFRVSLRLPFHTEPLALSGAEP